MSDFLTPLHLIFYLFAIIAVSASLAVIVVKNPVHSVLSLVLAFFAMAGVWMLLRAEFLSIILLLVYVGAVMTLFLFVVMMLNIQTEYKRGGFVRYLPLGILIVLIMTGLIITSIGPHYFGLSQMPLPPDQAASVSNTQLLGRLLYTDYAYPFEIAGVVLLAAMIAAISLTHRGPVKRKVQNISEQIAVTAKDRLSLIKMASEPKNKGK